MYKTRVSSGKPRSSPSFTSASILARNAASVFPEPVGAARSVCSPAAIAGHDSICTAVGASKLEANQARTAGWKVSKDNVC